MGSQVLTKVLRNFRSIFGILCCSYFFLFFSYVETPRLTHMQIIPPLVSDGAAAHLVAQVRNLVSLSPSCTYPC